MEALAIANDVRRARYELKCRVRDGEVSISAAVRAPEAATARLEQVLRWKDRWGQSRAAGVLDRAGLSPTLRCGAMTDRQRLHLARALRGERVRPWPTTPTTTGDDDAIRG